MDDRAFVAAFEDCSLPPAEFPHRAHVRLAWLYLREEPLLPVLGRYTAGIKRYATNLGAATKYHETITWAFLFLIHERMQRSSAPTFEAFAGENEDLFESILGRYYRAETLASDVARAAFVMPDLGVRRRAATL